MTLEEIEKLYENKEIALAQYLSLKAKLKPVKLDEKYESSGGYSLDYWVSHYSHAMLGIEKRADDNSSSDWTRKAVNNLHNGIMPFGFDGTNGTIAFIQYTKKHAPDKLEISIRTLLNGITNQTQLNYIREEALSCGIKV